MRHLNHSLLIIFAFLFCNMYAQTVKDSVYMTCIQCDSLYKRTCLDNPTVFSTPERLPKFQGGEKALFTFLASNIQYTQECIENRIEGRVVVQFIITEEGKIICERIRRSLHPALDEEALRVLRLMPDWQPASNNGVPFKMCYMLPILFKLQNSKGNGKKK